MCFFNYPHQEISNRKFEEDLFANSFFKPLTLKNGTLKIMTVIE